ncbi:MAG: two-component regulator propeller domain-containing protein [Bacteroidales bacterium]|jgi:streptogramin lyase|nr:two-component regulator propeller domain-containing protein [Bacteroidales bacterium]
MQAHRLVILSAVVFLMSFSVSAQNMGIGEWRTHLPYQKVIDVDIWNSKTYAATPYDLFVYDQDDNSISLLNKVNGLSDIGISAIQYNAEYEVLLVAYSNTNVDLIHADGISNISDIKDKELIGNKTINDILFRGKYAYLSCGFGIVVLDVEREEVYDTYLIGNEGDYINVLDIAFFDNKLFAATEAGVYYASIDSPNLADYNAWTKDNRLIHNNLRYNHIETFGDKLFLNYTKGVYNGDTLFMFDGSSWDYFEKQNNSIRTMLRAYENELLVCNNYNLYIYDKSLELQKSIYNPGEAGIEPQAVARSKNGTYWIGDRFRGLVKSTNGFDGENIKPNGPGTTNVYELKARGNQVWVASGGRANNWAKLYMVDGVFAYDGSQWTTHNRANTAAFDTISDFVSVAIDPTQPNKAYIGSWQDGIIAFTENSISEIYSVNNSSLQPWVAAPDLVNISGLDFDSYNNLWAANTGAPHLLSMRTSTGEWKSFNLGGSASGIDIANMIVDRNNYKWIIRRQEGMMMVFNDNNTFDNPADDRLRVLASSSGDGAIPGNQVLSMAVDLEGAVWVGTDAGPAIFYNTERIFAQGQNFDAQRILVPRNDGTGQADYLLGSEKILAIAVDGANNLWFGTENGVFLMSNDGLKQLQYFNTDNSPLLSNTVNSIGITDDGEVFFGTNNGIISYKGKATPGGPVNSDVFAYPNPVRPNHSGPVAIKGLVRNALVKITTVNGSLVYQTRAEGGQAIWDGKTLNGAVVEPGIYLVFISDDLGVETLVTKIMMMR